MIGGFWPHTKYIVQLLSGVYPISHGRTKDKYDGGPWSVSFLRLLWLKTKTDHASRRFKEMSDLARVVPNGQTIQAQMRRLCAETMTK